ncbi:hypothetical protein V8F20_005087 [Naviculisporaceae sp. PSN 640]
MWTMFDQASNRKLVFSDPCLRGFSCHLINQYLQIDPLHSKDILVSNARTAVDRVLAIQNSDKPQYNFMTGELRSWILQFALRTNDLPLFKSACSSLSNRQLVRNGQDAPPLPSFFAWLREYFSSRKDAIKFTSIQDELTTVVLAYTGLSDRFEAIDSLTRHELPYSEQTRAQRKWAQEIAVPYVKQTPDVSWLLKTAHDGRALVDIALFYAKPRFLVEFILSHILTESSCGQRWLWVIGFLTRLLERVDAEHLDGRLPKDVYRTIFSRVIGRLDQPMDIWATLDLLNPDRFSSAPWKSGITVPEMIQMICDLVNLGLVEELARFCQITAQRVRERSRSSAKDWKLLDRKDFGDYRTPPEGFKELSLLWVPFLQELALTIVNGQVGGNYRNIWSQLFTEILMSFARVSVGKQPPLEPDDLYRYPMMQPHKPWSDQYTELHNFLIDPTRKEARFSNYDNKLRARARSSVQYLNFHTYCDVKTRPSTFVMIKLSSSDPEHHQAWRERKEKFQDEIKKKFDQAFLKSLLGEEKYAEIMDMPFLNWARPTTAAVTEADTTRTSRKRGASQISTAPEG